MVLSSFNGKNWDSVLRWHFTLHPAWACVPTLVQHRTVLAVWCCTALWAAGQVSGAILGSLRCAPPCSMAGWGMNCSWSREGHWLFEYLRGSFSPSIFFPKALHGVNPELIWASTLPGGETAMSCKAYKIAFRWGLQEGWDNAGLCGLPSSMGWEGQGVCWLACLLPSCWWLSREWPSCQCQCLCPHLGLGWLPQEGSTGLSTVIAPASLNKAFLLHLNRPWINLGGECLQITPSA